MHRENSIGIGVAAALATAGATVPNASGGTVFAHSDLAAPGGATQFIALSDGEIHRPPRVLFSWGTGFTLPAGPFDRQFDSIDSPPQFDAFALIGVAQNGGVLVSFMNPGVAIGQTFESLFPGISEAALADALVNDPAGPLVSDFINMVDMTPGAGTPMGTESAVVHFSDGALYGTFVASFTPIPAPAAAAALLMLGGGVGARRRRPRF